MPSKAPVSGRISQDTYARMEEYREDHDLNKTDALRELLDSGLEAELTSDEESGEIETGPLTNSEHWFKKQFERSLNLMFHSAPVTLSIWLVLFLAAQIWGIETVTWLPGQALALLGILGIIAFTSASIGTLATYSALKLAVPRMIDQRDSSPEPTQTAE